MDLLYTDNRIVVCLKPAGVLSTDGPGGMPELLRRALGESETGCVRVVHRLDRPVGGVMVYARSRMADSILSRQVQEHEFEKDYLAVLEGCPDAPEGILTDLLVRDAAKSKPLSRILPARTRVPPVFRTGCSACGTGARSCVSGWKPAGHTRSARSFLPAACRSAATGNTVRKPMARSACVLSNCFFHPQTNEHLVFTHDPPQTEPWLAFFDTLKEK